LVYFQSSNASSKHQFSALTLVNLKELSSLHATIQTLFWVFFVFVGFFFFLFSSFSCYIAAAKKLAVAKAKKQALHFLQLRTQFSKNSVWHVEIMLFHLMAL